MYSNVALVMFTVLLMQLVTAGGWLIGQWALNLPRRPALHWGLAALFGAVGVALSLLRGVLPLALAIPVGNVFVLGSALLFVRGMRVFLELPLRDRESRVLMGMQALAALVSAATIDHVGIPILALSTSAGVLWLFLVAALQGRRALSAEFSGRVALALTLPLLLMCGMVLVRVAGALTGGAQALHVESVLNVAIALLYLLLTALLHLSMASMMVLRLVTSLQRLSTRDTLTGLFNRREWLNHLQARHRDLGRSGRSFSVLLVDIDHFKRINDTWGHPAGDAVLVSVSQRLEDSVRALDLVGRLGGEEFAVLLPQTGASEALAAAERLRLGLAAAPLGWQQLALEVTVSVGVATCEDGFESPERLIERADAALYAAKRAGRNRSMVSQPQGGALAASEASPVSALV